MPVSIFFEIAVKLLPTQIKINNENTTTANFIFIQLSIVSVSARQ